MNVKHTVANHLPVQESPKARQLGYPSFNGFKAVLPRRTKVAIVLCLSDGICINLLYDTVYVYFSIVNVLNRLSETVKFSCYLKIHSAINANRFLVVLQDLQQVLADTRFLEKREGMSKDFPGYTLSSILLYRSSPCIIGSKNTIECSCSV